MTDCRCAECGCCKHDHKGWKHEWTAKGAPLRLPTHMCATCGEPWFRDQPACLNEACPTHDYKWDM